MRTAYSYRQNIAVGDKLMAGNDVFFIGMSADDVYAHCTTDLPQLVRAKVVKDADDMLNSAGLDDDDADSLDGLEGQMQSAGVSLTDRGAAGFGTLKRSGALGGKKTMSKSEEAGEFPPQHGTGHFSFLNKIALPALSPHNRFFHVFRFCCTCCLPLVGFV